MEDRLIIRTKLLEDVAKYRLKLKIKDGLKSEHGIPVGYRKCTENEQYAVSPLGDLVNLKTGKFLYPKISKDGYHRVSIYVNGHPRNIYLHRIVAKAFLPNPENKPCVNHKDGIKTNCNVINLEWVTHKENHDHAKNVLKVGMFTLTVDQILINKIQMLVDTLEEINKQNKDQSIRTRIYRALKKLKEE
jgi:hypothetical protein